MRAAFGSISRRRPDSAPVALQGGQQVLEPVEHDAEAEFAGALLMPRGWLKQAFLDRPFRAGDDGALAELADRFQVSPQAMRIRLERFGWLH